MDATADPTSPHPDAGAPSAAHPRPSGWPASDLSQSFYAVLGAIPGLRQAIARRLDLNLSEVDAMEHLMGEAMGPVELSRRLHMTSASATVLVDRLEEAGHVVREADPHDGRRRLVRPTPQGMQSVYAQIGPMVADLVAVEDGMPERDRDAVVAYLQRVLGVLERHGESAPPG